MFRKLVANLPFSPSLIHQIGFYADRLRVEKSIRGFSVLFMVLALSVQSFAFISPPVSSLTYSNNHILSDLQNRSQILSAYDSNHRNLQDIYSYFGITRQDIANLPTKPNVTIKSNDGNNYRTIGRTSLWNYSKVHQSFKKTQKELPITQDFSVYSRELRAWDIVNSYNKYRAFEGTISATGQKFWVLADCGNITWKPPLQDPTPEPEPEPEPEPKVEIRKSIKTAVSSIQPGDSFTYRIEYRNKVINSVAEDVVIRDELDTNSYDVISPKNLNISSTGVLFYEVGDLPGSESYKFLDLTVQTKNPLPSGTTICNGARIQASNASPVSTKKDVCIDVITPCPYDPDIPNVNNPNCVEPVVRCKVVDAVVNLASREVTYKTTVTSSNESTTSISSYDYTFGDGSQTSYPVNSFMHETSHTYAPGVYETTATVFYRTVGQTTSADQSVNCSQPITFEDDQPLGQAKTVANITQDVSGEEALKTKVNAGDVLEYTVTTTNTQNYDRTGITVRDYIGDILDYANIDKAFLQQSNGTLDDSNTIVWENLTIPSQSQIDLTFRVTLKDPIPATNRPSATSGDFDCQIENAYGDLLSLSVNCPAIKGIETLPNTGPGSSLLMASGTTAIIGYFFARSRLLNKEIAAVRADYAVSGGM